MQEPTQLEEFIEIINRHLERSHYTFQLYPDKKITNARVNELKGHFSTCALDNTINYEWYEGLASDLLLKANEYGMAVTMQASVGKYGCRLKESAYYPTHVVLDYEIEERKKQPLVMFEDMDDFLAHCLKTTAPPEFVIRTSPGKGHFWWPLKNINENNWGTWIAVQDALLTKFSCDKSCKDPSRVFRVPGFIHQKSNPFPVAFHYKEELKEGYTLEQIIEAYDLKKIMSDRHSSINSLQGAVPVLTKERKEAVSKYKDVAAEFIEEQAETDEYAWETPDEIRDMISFLPVDGEIRDWSDWVAVGTAIARKFIEKKNLGFKGWTVAEAREIFLFFCDRCPHYKPGKYDPTQVWKNCLDMARKPVPINSPKHTLASIVDVASDHGWTRQEYPSSEGVELVSIVEETEIKDVVQKDGSVKQEKIKKKVVRGLRVTPDLLENVEPNDFSLARIVSVITKDCLKYHNGLGWVQWNGKHWYESGEDSPPYAIINQVYNKLSYQCMRKMVKVNKKYSGQKDLPKKTPSTPANKVEAIDYRSKKFQANYGPLEELLKYLKQKARSENNLRSVAKIAKCFQRSKIETEELDFEDHLFCAANGVVDLRTGELQKHSDHIGSFITKISPTNYNSKAEPPEEWFKFLNSVFGGDQELINFIQVAVGYSLTGSATERCFFLLHGRGRNGKSTFINVVRGLLGYKYSTTVSADTLTGKTAVGQIPVGIAKLRGMRMASTSESDENQRLKEGTIKALTGDDTVTARFMRQNEFEFRCMAKIWFGTNHLPLIKGDDEGIWDRIKLIKFNKRYYFEYEKEKIEEARKADPGEIIEYVDKELGKKLSLESEAILAWAVQGAITWHQSGLPRCQVVDDACKEYRNDQDQFSYFLDNFICQTYNDDDKVLIRDLMELCKEQTGYRYTAQRLRKILTERGYVVEKIESGAAVIGIKTTVSSLASKRKEEEKDEQLEYGSYEDEVV